MRRLFTSGIFVVFCFLTVVILAQVPQLLNYQGRLTDDKGIPIITTITVRFSLYEGGDAATPSSGTLVYREEASVTPDDNGVFNHLIGSGTVIFGALDSTVFQTASPVFLETAIDPAGANETLLPRKQIVTVGYSFKSELADDADTVDGQDASAFAPVVHNHDPDYVNEEQADSVTSSMIADGTIVDADINASANIAGSKINPTGLDADLLDGEHASAFAPVVHNHDPDYVNEQQADSVTSAMIVDGTIVDADINASANIAGSKIDPTGLDADLLDGLHSASFVHTGGGVMTGPLHISTSDPLTLYAENSHGEGFAVWGKATHSSGATFGVRGQNSSPLGYGVYGFATAVSGVNYGVYGITYSTSGYAGYFKGRVHVTGNLTVDGAKTCVQPIDNGKKVLLYAMESPEIWFEDFGSAQLVNGQAVVQLESVFTQAANTGISYFVFLTPIGEWKGLYISRQDKDSFEVREQGGGTSSINFYYRIVAKRRGYEEVRFEEFTEPEQPPEEAQLPVAPKETKLKQPQRP
ncbi:MAG: hypothetical protein OEZ30_06585 [Candidatus Aminicenantes bacterium]|nr:hypothetical protein [Candidatus Aminicenantes bacterium]MDH5715211.1 hypothetical protein [Candidatus Aminicenantes bacterium]